MGLIYKIFLDSQNEAFESNKETCGAPIDVADGYIHFSTRETVLATAEKYFAGVTGLKLLAVDADSLGASLRWEAARGGVLFPHLYRSLRTDDVLWTKDLVLCGGKHVFPSE